MQLSPECTDLLRQLLKYDTNERFDLKMVKTHPFYKNSPIDYNEVLLTASSCPEIPDYD